MADQEAAQAWLEHMAGQWLTQPETTPSFPVGLVINDAGWRIVLAPLPGRPTLERIKLADEVEFYATLPDGREVTTRRPRSAMVWAAALSWQAGPCCCCGHEGCRG